jgi:hypothetical protein
LPDEIEVPTEHLHEVMHEEHHKAQGGHHNAPHAGGGNFTLGVALSSAILAVVAALAALFAGHHANEAMIDRVEAGDRWSYFQAKGIKANVLRSKLETLAALDKEPSAKDQAKLAGYADDQRDIEKKARGLTDASEAHLDRHNTLASSVTFFQIAIALGAISVLTKKRPLWFVSLAVGITGLAFMSKGFTPIEPRFHEVEEEAARESGSEGGDKPEKSEKVERPAHGAEAPAPAEAK